MSDEDFVIRSVTVSEIMTPNGKRYLAVTDEGEPSDWETLGMLDYATACIRNRADLDLDIDDNDDD